MKCSNCGAELQEGMKFCPECGMRIKGTKVINAPRDRKVAAPATARAATDALDAVAATSEKAAGGQAPVQGDAAPIDTGDFAPSVHAGEPSAQAPAEPAQKKEGSIPAFLQNAMKRFSSRKEDVAPADAAPEAEEAAAPEAVPEVAAEEPVQAEGTPAEEPPAEHEASAGAEDEVPTAGPSDDAEPGKPADEARKGSILRGKPVAHIHIHAKGKPEDEEKHGEEPSAEPEEADEPTGRLPHVNPADIPSVEDEPEEASGDEAPEAERLMGEDADLSGFDKVPEPGEGEFDDDDYVIPAEPIFELGEELPEIETAEEELSHVPQIDEELASADQADIPQDLPASVDDVDDEEAEPEPVSYAPLRATAHRPLRANSRRMEIADGQLRPLEPYVATDLPDLDEEMEDEDFGRAVPEAGSEPSGAVAPEPVAQGRRRDAQPQERRPKAEHPQKKGASRHLLPLLIVAAAAACALIVIVVAGQTGTPSATTEETATTAEETSSETAAEQQGPTATLPAEAKSFGDYSWSEIAGIAQAIEGASSRDEALSIAAKYGLADADGTPTTKTKELQLKDGTSAQVQVADIYMDDKTDGGKAGITFLVTGSSLTHAMNADGTTDGGWKSSDMRSWLAQEVLPSLPDELQSFIVPVDKLTNNIGYTLDTASVTSTSDSLWIPSFAEVFGSVNWNWQSSYSTNYNTILNSEGYQYACFANAGSFYGMATAAQLENATGIGTNGATWWLRTPSPTASNHFRDVSQTAGPYSVDDADEAMGVVFGFCL